MQIFSVVFDFQLSVTVKLPSGSEFSLELDLAHAIVPAQCKTRIMSTKVKTSKHLVKCQVINVTEIMMYHTFSLYIYNYLFSGLIINNLL